MSVYTVHEPPRRAGAAAADVERFAFVRDGFSWWAFLLAPLWMLRHRMWLVLIGYVVDRRRDRNSGEDIRWAGLATSLIGICLASWSGSRPARCAASR